VLSGLPAEEARERVEALKTNGPLWRLRVNCLRYCRFVHSHHNAEDALFFPTLRAANPDLAPVVDKLAAELLVHLDFEEREAGPAIRSLDRHPFD
jgi:hypothetical protein